ncbi:MAG: peptidylprolyl isomerase, partial [Acidimicrobiales bacterium]
CTDAALDSVVQGLGAAVGSDASRGEVVLGAFPQAYQDELIERTANVLALQGALVDLDCVVDDAVDQFYEDQPDQFLQACVSLITVASEEDAADVKTELERGADFATLAQRESLDAYAGTGGDLGCLLRAAFTDAPELGAAVFAATPGVPGGPVPSSLGWHAFVVREVRTPALDEVRDQAPGLLSAYVGDAFQQWFTAAVDDAEVEVDSHYGVWDPIQGQIVAPGSPTPASTTTAPPPAGG